MIGYIYKHTSPSGKSYIGQTASTLKSRWDSGFGYGADTIFGKAIKKYGWSNFQHEIVRIVDCPTKEELFIKLNELEIEEIRVQDTVYPNGYNGTFGGRSTIITTHQKAKISKSLMGRKLSQEHSNNISSALKRRWEDDTWREDFSKKMIAKHQNPEFRAKRAASISRSLKGRKISDEWRQKLSEAAKKRWENPLLKNEVSIRMKSLERKRDKNGRYIKTKTDFDNS